MNYINGFMPAIEKTLRQDAFVFDYSHLLVDFDQVDVPFAVVYEKMAICCEPAPRRSATRHIAA